GPAGPRPHRDRRAAAPRGRRQGRAHARRALPRARRRRGHHVDVPAARRTLRGCDTRNGTMRDVAAIGFGMHPWGKFPDKSVTQLCRAAVDAALADAGVAWRDVQAVAAASSRFSGGRGWGLNGNDVIEDMGATGVPVYNLSAGCAAGGNAFNVGWMMV